MEKMKRKFLLPAMATTLLVLSACNGFGGSMGTTSDNQFIPTTPYESIYQGYRTTRYEYISPLSPQMAEQGYIQNDQQGHNNWFYQFENSAGEGEMIWQNNRWENQSAYIDGKIMKSTSDVSAVRRYVVKEGGEGTVNIFGRIIPVDSPNKNGFLLVKKESLVLKRVPLNGDEKDGRFFSFTTFVQGGDKLDFVLEGNLEISFNPILSYGNLTFDSLHQDLTGTFENGKVKHYGDVHPYYANGKMYMYYLATNGNYDTLLTDSGNMINFAPNEGLRKDGTNGPTAPYYVLGITKEGDEYRSLFGYSSSVIFGSKSKDLLVWEDGQGVDDNFVTTFLPRVSYPGGARDPYVFYDPDTNQYRAIYLGYYNNKFYEGQNPNDFDCGLSVVTSVGDSMAYWQDQQREVLRFDNAGASKRDEPECPQMMKIGNRWYIFASLYGQSVHGVGALSYWTGEANKTIDKANFLSNGERRLDGEDLCAAQLVQVNDRVYMFGWIPQKADAGDWGGALNIMREVYQKSDGSLATRLDPYMTNLLNGGLLFSSLNDESAISNQYDVEDGVIHFTDVTTSETGISAHPLHTFMIPDTYSRTMLQFKVEKKDSSRFGFRLDSENSTKYSAGIIDVDGKQIQLIKKTSGGIQTRSKLSNIELKDEVNVKVIIEGTFVELFIDDQYSLTGKMDNVELQDFTISLFADDQAALIKDVRVSMLTPGQYVYSL
ncbi:MAG TPA: hypothetical protein PKC96_02160 [Bacilli bacterium]|nr:hypothetical protein [Bacilli bacterium]